MLEFTKEEVDKMSDTEVVTYFGMMRQAEEIKKMRKALRDIVDIDEANVNIIKLEK